MAWSDEGDADRILAQTTALLAERGDEQAVALLVDVQAIEFADTDSEHRRYYDQSWGCQVTVWEKTALLDVDDHIVARFTDDVTDRIMPVLTYVAERNEVEGVRYIEPRPALPEVDSGWRETCAARLTAEGLTN